MVKHAVYPPGFGCVVPVCWTVILSGPGGAVNTVTRGLTTQKGVADDG